MRGAENGQKRAYSGRGCSAHPGTVARLHSGPLSVLGVTSCPRSTTPYTRDLTMFYISTSSMLFDVWDQSCW